MGEQRDFHDFGEALARCREVEAAWLLLTRVAARLGYHSVDYILAVLLRPVPHSTEDFKIIKRLATDLGQDHYVEQEYHYHDRVTQVALSALLPYSYADTKSGLPKGGRRRKMEGEVAAKVVRSGLNIPLHGPGPAFASVKLGSPLEEPERRRRDRDTLPGIYLMAAQFNARMHQMLDVRFEHDAGPLSTRERDCLAWAAQGKTAWETSKILTISESAVKKHLSAAAAKLGARTRTQAVAMALSQRLIQA